MWARFKYYARETLISLRRNLGMTIAGVLTVTVSLIILGSGLLVGHMVDHGTQHWKNGVTLEIFMNVKATNDQINALSDELAHDKEVRHFEFVTHDQAYKEYKRLGGSVDLISPSDLPVSYKVAPHQASRSQEIADRYHVVSGVEKINTADEQIKNLLSFTNTVTFAIYALCAALLVAALFLIVNTIRLATFARRREIEIMKLVGASNWFVRIPFMLEGIIQGLIGGAIALFAVWILKIALTNTIDGTHGIWVGWYVTGSDATVVGLTVLVLGALIGAVGSFFGLYRFLEA